MGGRETEDVGGEREAESMEGWALEHGMPETQSYITLRFTVTKLKQK